MASTKIIHHANCPDGFGAAWLLARNLHVDADIIAASYGDPLPPDIDDADIYVVDFCYEPDDLTKLANQAASVLILDHHQTALGYIKDTGFTVFDTVTEFLSSNDGLSPYVAVLDMNRSGIGLVSEFTGDYTHQFVFNIEDRDLWRFKLPDTAEVFSAVTSRPYETTAWNFMAAIEHHELVAEGAAILRYRNQLIDQAVATAFTTDILGHTVWCAACPYAIGSDVAGVLAERTPELFAAYFVHYGTRIRYGLRSGPDGLDVAELAALRGGGGHRHAAGFEIPVVNRVEVLV